LYIVGVAGQHTWSTHRWHNIDAGERAKDSYPASCVAAQAKLAAASTPQARLRVHERMNRNFKIFQR
jgi:hypothetical protein